MGSYKLVPQLTTFTSCMSYHKLTAMYLDMTTVTSDRVLLLILAASSYTDNL